MNLWMLTVTQNVRELPARFHKPQPWQAGRRHRFFGVLGLAVWMIPLAGCPQTPQDQSSSNQEPTFAQQLADIKQGHSSEISVISTSLTDEEIRQLSAVAGQLRILSLGQATLSADDWYAFASAGPILERLKLAHDVDDQQLQAIATIASLKVLNLPGGRFTDAGLAHLVALPHLELLRFHSSLVTDGGLEEIARYPSLRFLHLIDTPVTDAGLQTIAGMTRLESFYLDGSQCTEAGLSALVKQRPDLHFHWNDLHLPGDANSHQH